MPQLRYTVELHVFLGQLYFKYESAGKCHRKNLRSEVSISKTSAWRAKKLLQMQPCKTMVVHALKEHDLVGRLYFYSQFLQSVNDGEVEPHLVFFF